MGDEDLRRLLRQLRDLPDPDPMAERLMEMYRMEMKPSREWERRLIDEFDFDFAIKFAKRLLDERGKPPADWDEVVIQALWLAAVVSYARPFTTRLDRSQKEEPPGYAKVIEEKLNDDGARQHQQLVDSRHTEHAHSDASARDVKVSDMGPPFGKVPVMRAVHFAPPNEQVEQLIALAEKFRAFAIERRQELGI